MNKTELIDKLAKVMNEDKKTAATAVEGFIDIVQREVKAGRNVSISGFGVFEKRQRAARTARNPRTGEPVKVKRRSVPSFRPGTAFKDIVAGKLKLPRASEGLMTARAMTAAAKDQPAGAKAAPKKAAAKKPAAKAAPKKAAAKKPAAKAAPKKAAPKKPAAKKPAAKAAPKKAAPKKAAAKQTAAKKTTAKKK